MEPGHALGDDAAHLVELPGDENRAGGHLQVEHAVDAADRRRPRLDGAGVLVEGGEVAADLAGDGGEVTAGVDEGAADVDGLEVAVAGLLPDEGAGGGAPGLDAVAGGVGAPGGHEGQRPVARQRHRRQRHRDPGVPGGGQAGGGVDGGEALAGGGADGGEVAGHIDLGLVGRDPDAVDARVEVGVPGLDRSGVDRDAGQPVAGQAAEGGERAADVEAGPGQGQVLDGGAGRRLPGRRDRAGGGVEPGQAVAGDAVDGVEDAAGIEPGAIGHHGVDGPVGVGHEP